MITVIYGIAGISSVIALESIYCSVRRVGKAEKKYKIDATTYDNLSLLLLAK